MAIAASNILSAGLTSPTATTNTASWAPAASRLYLASVFTNHDTASPSAPTFAGNGLTWVQVGSLLFVSTNISRITVFRAMGASPSTGVSTITWVTTPTEGGVWSIDEFTGMDTSGTNGSGAIAQAAITGTGTTTAASFAFGSITAGNAVFGAFANGAATGATADTVGSGYTKLGESSHTTSPDWDGHLMAEWRAAQTTVNATIGSLSATANAWGGVAIEILAAGATAAYQPRDLAHSMLHQTLIAQ